MGREIEAVAPPRLDATPLRIGIGRGIGRRPRRWRREHPGRDGSIEPQASKALLDLLRVGVESVDAAPVHLSSTRLQGVLEPLTLALGGSRDLGRDLLTWRDEAPLAPRAPAASSPRIRSRE
jgi:hypothetical protein